MHVTADASTAVESADGPDAPPELPELEPGLTLLSADERTRNALHALVVDAVLRDGATARWVDARGHASTQPLAALAPGPRVLERIHVARGFTPFQHYSIVETLCERAEAGRVDAGRPGPERADETGGAVETRDGPERADAVDPGLVVAPALDAMYRADEVRQAEGQEMLARAIAALAGLARRRDVPVLCTRSAADGFAAPIAAAASRTVECAWTAQGPRFAGEEFETLVYPVGQGYIQTTLAYWERVLAHRASTVHGRPAASVRRDEEPATVEPSAPTATAGPTLATAAGSTGPWGR